MKARRWMAMTMLAGMVFAGALACEENPYAGPTDPGDVEMELQTGGWIAVPVDDIQTVEPGDNGTMVWTHDDSFVVREDPGTIRERMQDARRQLQAG